MKLYISFISFIKFLKVICTNNLLTFSYNKIKYGDIVYDTYLVLKKVPTINHFIKIDIFLLIYNCIKRHRILEQIIKKNNVSAVLVTHNIGVKSGILLRIGMQKNCEIYYHTGHKEISFIKLISKDPYNHIYTPPKDFIDSLIMKSGDFVKSYYDKLFRKVINAKSNIDVENAYSEKSLNFKNKKEFNDFFHLDIGRKNVFVMLHAFYDHPHSHFKKMIFKDYYDWMKRTLKYAKKHTHVNWIFKQHPSHKYYPLSKDYISEDFKNLPSNVIYIDEDNQISTFCIKNIANVIITCCGSAGFEIPSMSNIPVICAGDNFYNHLGFTNNPKSKKEYFKLLDEIGHLPKLSEKQQLIAKATYIFINDIRRISMHSSAFTNVELIKSKNLHTEDIFWKKTLENYSSNEEKIMDQISDLINKIRKPDFNQLYNT